MRTHHRRRAGADPHALWEAAQSVRLDETRTLGRLVRWRIPGTPPDLAYRELFRHYPFTLLEEGDGYSLSGLAGRIWTFQRDYPRLDGVDDFLAFDDRDAVRVVFAHWVEETGDGAEIVSEARVEPTDRLAAVRLRALWAVVGHLERFVAAEPLTLAARRAERR